MANSFIKKCFISLIIRETQIKNNERYNLTSVRLVYFNNVGVDEGKKPSFTNECHNFGKQYGHVSKN